MSEETSPEEQNERDPNLVNLVLTKQQLAILFQLANAGIPNAVQSANDVEATYGVLQVIKAAVQQ